MQLLTALTAPPTCETVSLAWPQGHLAGSGDPLSLPTTPMTFSNIK